MGCSGHTVNESINKIINNNINNNININNINNNINEMRNELLKYHNKYRKYHNSNDLIINNNLNDRAQEYANKRIKNTQFKQSFFYNAYKDIILGENVYCSKEKADPETICKEWYNENKKYDYKKNSYQNGTGHFTQLVWKNTKEVGFGISSNNDSFNVVAYYYPAGNVLGEFQNNVFKKDKLKKNNNI